MGDLILSDIIQIVQLAGCVTVFFLPLTSQRSRFWLRALAGVVIIVGMACLTGWIKYIIQGTLGDSFASNTLYVVLYYTQYAVVAGVMWMCFKSTPSLFVFIFLGGLIAYNIIDAIGTCIIGAITIDMGYWWVPTELAVTAAVVALMRITLVRLLRHNMENFDRNISALFYLGLLIVLAFLNMLLMTIFRASVTPYLHYASFAAVLVMDTLYFLIQFGYFYLTKNRAEREALSAMLAEKEKQYEMSRRNMELVNIKSHDLKRQLEALRLAGDKDRKESLDEMQKVINDYDTTVNTENQALSVLLTEKSRACEEKGITFSCIADGAKTGFINSVDLYSIMGNALDNAIESAEVLPEDRRSVSITIKEKSRMLCIQVMNYFDPEKLKKEDGAFRTSKEDDRNHGFGTKSIQNIAEKYGGTVVFDTNDGIFTLQIVIPMPSQHEKNKAHAYASQSGVEPGMQAE